MIKSKRFEPIQEIAATSAQDLSRVMAEAGRKVADLERQLQQLQNYRSFLDRLGEALRQHLKSLDAARKEFDKRRAQWSEKRVEAETLNRVVDRFRKEEQHAANRREQREGDEAAMRLMLTARTDAGSI
jgi:flagellar export protein FliJ